MPFKDYNCVEVWIVFGKVWQPKDTAVPGHGQVVGHVGLPKPPGYKSAPVTEVGVEEEAGEKYYYVHTTPPTTTTTTCTQPSSQIFWAGARAS